uniref:Uncharacterized protein n=1 Tax=viral metagenome TaxID=1070528 RepID=A0A6C0KVM6_9ZZZZ
MFSFRPRTAEEKTDNLKEKLLSKLDDLLVRYTKTWNNFQDRRDRLAYVAFNSPNRQFLQEQIDENESNTEIVKKMIDIINNYRKLIFGIEKTEPVRIRSNTSESSYLEYIIWFNSFKNRAISILEKTVEDSQKILDELSNDYVTSRILSDIIRITPNIILQIGDLKYARNDWARHSRGNNNIPVSATSYIPPILDINSETPSEIVVAKDVNRIDVPLATIDMTTMGRTSNVLDLSEEGLIKLRQKNLVAEGSDVEEIVDPDYNESLRGVVRLPQQGKTRGGRKRNKNKGNKKSKKNGIKKRNKTAKKKNKRHTNKRKYK